MFDHRCGSRSCSSPCLEATCELKAHWKFRVCLHSFWCLVWIALIVIVSCAWYSTFVDKASHKALPSEQFPNGIDLYYGIQWWGPGNVLHPVVNETTGLGQGPSKYFDPRKPTVIYSHGWQNGGVTGHGLERLTSHTGVDMADIWIEQGYNVGSFYWTQFADDDIDKAETKIWETCLDSGNCFPSGEMRWKDKDGKSHPWKDPNGKTEGVGKSVGDIFYDSVVACLDSADTSAGSKFSLRLVGHSLGGGNVMAAGYKLAADADNGKIKPFLKPERIAMLDPYWSVSREAQVLWRMYELSHKHNVTLEMLRTSDFSAIAHYGNALKSLKVDDAAVVISVLYPGYVDPLLNDMLSGPAEALRHMSAKAYYFLSMDPQNPNAKNGPSARTDNAVLRDFKNSGKFWKQVAGLYTESILDDKYETESFSDSPPIKGGNPSSWAFFFYSLTCTFFTLTTCVVCCCFCYSHEFMKARSRARQPGDLGIDLNHLVEDNADGTPA